MSASRQFDTRKAWSTLQASFQTICWQMGLAVISSQEQGCVPPARPARQGDLCSHTPSQLALGLELIAQLVPVPLHPLLSPRCSSPLHSIANPHPPRSTALLGVLWCLLWLSFCLGCHTWARLALQAIHLPSSVFSWSQLWAERSGMSRGCQRKCSVVVVGLGTCTG